MANKVSSHILNTAANLLGFCLFVITSLHITDKSASSIIDEFASFIALLLSFSCLFSFMSIRTNNMKSEMKLEKIADYFFLFSLGGIILIIFLLVFNFIK